MESIVIAFLAGILVGIGAGWLVVRSRALAENRIGDRFESLAAEALRQSNESFLQLAESRLKQSEIAASAVLDKKTAAIDDLIKPVKETLGKMDVQLKEIELARHGAYKELMQAVVLSNETQQKLRTETSQLLQALRTPSTRGQWGEIQVRRILEMTGMAEHTRDFSSQHHVQDKDGAIRPDYVVTLPGGKCVVIDSKVPLTSYLDGAQSEAPAVKQAAMEKHARQVREHIRLLSSKSYWDKIDGSASFVVLFVPGDHFLSGALDCDPDLIEYGTTHNVVLATPVTLIALLRTVALGWQQENLRENAEKLGALGGELYAAVATMASYVADIGAKIGNSVDSYNKLVGNLERTVLSKARKLKDFGANSEGKEIPESPAPLEKAPRALKSVREEGNEDAA